MVNLKDGRTKLFQWDTNRYVLVPGECSEVHFSNKLLGRSLDVPVVNGEARIPDVLLQTDKCLHVWAFVGSAADGYTKISKVFEIEKRNKPADYLFTQEEYATLADVIKRLEALEGQVTPESIGNAVDDYLTENPVEIPVDSVNGKTGEVELTAEDVGALPANTEIPTVPKNVSEFENDAKYQNEEQVRATAQQEAKKVEDKIPNVPTNVSAFVNDAEYQTADEVAETVEASANAIEKKIPIIPTKVSVFANDAKYQTEADVTNVKNELSAEIAGKQDPIEKYVSEVNGKTGNVTLTPNDVGALPSDADVVSSAELQSGLNTKQDVINRYAESVNGMSGAVVLSASDVNALPDSTVIPTVPTNVSAFQNDADYATRTFVQETANGKNSAFVFDSVAALDTWLSDSENVSRLKTGDVFWIRDTEVPDYWWDGENQTKQIMETTKVNLSAYALKTEIPVKTSDLQNDSDFATNAGVDTKLGGYQPKLSQYVKTVNGKSGAVNLNASDVGALPSSTQIPVIPSNVSTFYNDAKYITEDVLDSALRKKQNTLAFDNMPALGSQNPVYSDGIKKAIDDANNVFIVEFEVSLQQNGQLDLSLPTGMRPSDIFNAYNNNFHVIGIFDIPSIAGEYAGKFIASANKRGNDHSILFVAFDKSLMQWVQVSDLGDISFGVSRYEVTGNKVTVISPESTDAQYPSAKATYEMIENVKDCFYVPINFDQNGFSLNGVTHEEIYNSYKAKGKRIVAKCYVPASAGLGAWGEFNIPMTCLQDNSTFTLAFLSGTTSVEVFVASDNSVSYNINVLQNIESRVTSITSSATHTSYPTAKAVYDYIESRLNGLTFRTAAAPSDDPNTITFVDEE